MRCYLKCTVKLSSELGEIINKNKMQTSCMQNKKKTQRFNRISFYFSCGVNSMCIKEES